MIVNTDATTWLSMDGMNPLPAASGLAPFVGSWRLTLWGGLFLPEPEPHVDAGMVRFAWFERGATLAKRLIAERCEKQEIVRGKLTVHADRASSMTSKPVALLLVDLGVRKSHSRPPASNDNPYSESQVQTLKYGLQFSGRFGCQEDSRLFCNAFFALYNIEHRHSGLGYHTPESVHSGPAAGIREQRAAVLAPAHEAHPDRFVRAIPRPPMLPMTVRIIPPAKEVNKAQ